MLLGIARVHDHQEIRFAENQIKIGPKLRIFALKTLQIHGVFFLPANAKGRSRDTGDSDWKFFPSQFKGTLAMTRRHHRKPSQPWITAQSGWCSPVLSEKCKFNDVTSVVLHALAYGCNWAIGDSGSALAITPPFFCPKPGAKMLINKDFMGGKSAYFNQKCLFIGPRVVKLITTSPSSKLGKNWNGTQVRGHSRYHLPKTVSK